MIADTAVPAQPRNPPGETPVRSIARAHLSQLIEMFGADGCLRVATSSETDPDDSSPVATPDRREPGEPKEQEEEQEEEEERS